MVSFILFNGTSKEIDLADRLHHHDVGSILSPHLDLFEFLAPYYFIFLMNFLELSSIPILIGSLGFL